MNGDIDLYAMSPTKGYRSEVLPINLDFKQSLLNYLNHALHDLTLQLHADYGGDIERRLSSR